MERVGIMGNKKTGHSNTTIAQNKKSRHDYELEEHFEAGLVLLGWEVKSIRAGRIQLKESYVILKEGAAWLFGAHISPLPSACAYIHADPLRTRKLLLHRRELNKLFGAVQRKGYTIVPTAMYWKHGRAKLDIALAKGKKTYDKRATEKERDWSREKQRAIRSHGKDD